MVPSGGGRDGAFEWISLSQVIHWTLPDTHVAYTPIPPTNGIDYAHRFVFMMQLRAAADQAIAPRLRESLGFVVDVVTHALPEDDVFIFSKRQFQKAFGDRGDPPRCEHLKRQDPRYIHIPREGGA